MDNPTIIFPVTLKVWVVNDNTIKFDNQYKDLAVDYGDINTFNGTSLENNDVFYAPKLTLKDRGIHLHWSLPNVFSHGINYNDDLYFPPVPNRWLITRYKDFGDEVLLDNWVIESDYLGQDGEVSWVENKGDVFRVTRIGRANNLKKWLDQTDRTPIPAAPLKAIGPGNPLFAASYWSCKNVFGFHDNEIDPINVVKYSYSVTGWFSDNMLNSLHNEHKTLVDNEPIPSYIKKNLTDYQLQIDAFRQNLLNDRKEFIRTNCKIALLEENGTLKLADIEKNKSYSVLCHAANYNVIWNNAAGPDTDYQQSSIAFTVANNTKEALGAHIGLSFGNNSIVQNNGTWPVASSGNFITALLSNYLKDAPNINEFEVALHEQIFNPVEGGYVWEIISASGANNTERTENKSFPDKKSFESQQGDDIYQNFTKKFFELNNKQLLWDQSLRRINTLKTAFRLEIDKLNHFISELAKIDPQFSPEDYSKPEELNSYLINNHKQHADILKSLLDNLSLINDEITTVDQKRNQYEAECFIKKIANGEQHFGSLVTEINCLLKKIIPSESGVYQLVRKKLPDFYEPTDPLILFHFPEKSPEDEIYSPVTGDKSLVAFCRTGDQLINSINTSTKIIKKTAINAIDGLERHLNKGMHEVFKNLLSETITFHSFYGSNNTGGKTLQSFYAESENEIAFVYPERKINMNSVPAEWMAKLLYLLGGSLFKQSWFPLFMLWGIDWHPDYTLEGDTYTYNDKKWEFNEDHKFKKSVPLGSKHPEAKISYAGHNVLAKISIENIKPEFKTILARSKGSYFAQTLSGFNNNLLMKKMAINIPVGKSPAIGLLKPTPGPEKYENVENYAFPEIGALGDNGQIDLFFPIRAGHVLINNLWLIDNFGRIHKIVHKRKQSANDSMNLCLSLNDNQIVRTEKILFPPQLIVPARLNFRFIAINPKYADSSNLAEFAPTTSNPSSTPVFGWIVFNKLNRSLLLFNHSGGFLGELMSKSDFDAGKNTAFLWRTEITTADVTSSKLEAKGVLAGQSELTGFINYVISRFDRWHTLCQVIENVAQSINSSATEKDPCLADLLGVPLALVNAGIKLEHYSRINGPQSWKARPNLKDDGNYHGLKKNQSFSVRLGQKRNRKDGLIGYFADNNFEEMYSHYYKDQSDAAKNYYPEKYFYPDNLILKMNNIESEKKLTLLMYAGAGVHAHSGILPAQYIELPATIVNSGINSLEFNILTAPLIASTVDAAFPVTDEPGYTWHWQSAPKNGDSIATEIEIKVRTDSETQEKNFTKQQIIEGYLKLKKSKKNNP